MNKSVVIGIIIAVVIATAIGTVVAYTEFSNGEKIIESSQQPTREGNTVSLTLEDKVGLGDSP